MLEITLVNDGDLRALRHWRVRGCSEVGLHRPLQQPVAVIAIVDDMPTVFAVFGRRGATGFGQHQVFGKHRRVGWHGQPVDVLVFHELLAQVQLVDAFRVTGLAALVMLFTTLLTRNIVRLLQESVLRDL